MKNTKLIIISASLIISFLTISSAGAETGLVGYWKMENNWDDSSGNENNGTGHGGAGFADGKVGRCGSYGNNKYVDVGDMDNPFDGSSSNMTISMWVKSGGSNSGTVGLVSKGVSGNAIFEFRFYSDDSFSLHARDPGGNNYVTVASGSFDDWVGNWHHISAVVELNPLNIKLYRDGVDLPTSSSSAGTPPTVWDDIPDSVEIGRLRWAIGTRYFNGLIDEVKIYNRALSEEEIKAQYYLYLVALYHMDEDSWDGTLFEVIDSSGQGNHGRAHGEANTVASDNHYSGHDYGNCGSFDGTNDYVNCGNDASLNLRNTLSIEAWIKPDTIPPPTKQASIVDRSSDNATGYWFYLANTRVLGFLRFKGTWDAVGSTGTILTGTWTHAVVTYDDSVPNEVTFYINGRFDKAVSLNGPIDSSANNLLIGDRGNLHFFDGLIDEVAIYNRVLTEEEIYTHYGKGPPEGPGPIDIYKTSGIYISSVKDAEESVSWKKISWEEDASYGEELESESGMVGLWHMNDNWEDSSGSGNNGAPHGVGFDSGKFNTSGGKFDGSNDYVNCGNGNSLNIRNTITIEAWIKPDTLSTVNQNAIVSKSLGYWFFVSTGQKLSFLRFNANDPPTGYGRFSSFSTTATIPTGTWTHVAATYDTTIGNTVKLYIDGELSREGNFTNGLIDSTTSSLTIGEWQNLHFFDGTIDEVAIYNRTLSASEILEHYKRGVCNLKFQVRSGSADPPTGDFIGPDGISDTYFTDASGEDEGIDVPDNRYFQYKAYFSTEDKRHTPELHSVTITYGSDGGGGVSGVYIYQWEEIFE